MRPVDAVWKAPVTAAEDFDKTMAQRIAAAAAQAISAESLEAYWRQHDDPAFTEDVAHFPEGLLDEFESLFAGQSHLQLPDGSRWVMGYALLPSDVLADIGDNAFLRRLDALLREHRVLRECILGPRRPLVMLNADTLDLRRVVCSESGCRCWVDLVADAEEADRTMAPWDGAE